MPAQQIIDRVDRLIQPGLELAGRKRGRHRRSDRAPLGRVDVPAQATVGDDLDRVLGEQQVDQHAVVVFGVPDAQLAEHRDGAFARARVAPQVTPWQAGFHTHADLAAVLRFARRDARLDALHRVGADLAQCVGFVESPVLEEPQQGMGHRCHV